jgi:hypothetical protein
MSVQFISFVTVHIQAKDKIVPLYNEEPINEDVGSMEVSLHAFLTSTLDEV